MVQRVTRPDSARVARTTPAATTTPSRTPASTGTPAAEGWVAPARSRSAGAGPVLNPTTRPLASSSATAFNPLDAMRLVRNGDVEITVPIKGGDFADGKVHADKNTVIKMKLKVKDGVIDFKKSNVRFDPALKGPLGINVDGVNMRSDGRAEVDVAWLPNVSVGNASSGNLADFIESLQSAKKFPVRVLGINVYTIETDTGAPATTPRPAATSTSTTPTAPKPSTPSELAMVAEQIDLSKVSISMKNVKFADGQLPIGGGRVRLGSDATMSIEGSLADLKMKGRVNIADLAFNTDSLQLEGGAGSADIEVDWKSTSLTDGVVKATVSNLNVKADYAVTRRPNGDFIELAQGMLTNGAIVVSQTVKNGEPSGKPQSAMKIQQFDGTVKSGQITLPDGNGTATVKLGQTRLKGAVEVSTERIFVSGDVELNAEVSNYDTPSGDAQLAFSKVSVNGKAKGTFDSNRGLQVDGAVRVKASLTSGTMRAENGAVASRLKKSELDVAATGFALGNDGSLDIRGKATVDVSATGIDVGDAGASLKGGAARIRGQADVHVSNKDIRLTNGNLRMSASVEDGKLHMGDDVFLDLKAGTKVEAAMTSAWFGSKTALDLSKATLDAALDGGSVKLPNGQKLNFKNGSRLAFSLDTFKLPAGGKSEVSGSMELEANLAADQLDLDGLANLPGVSFTRAEGFEQFFKLKLGRFSLDRTGAFSAEDLVFGIEARIRRLGGTITN